MRKLNTKRYLRMLTLSTRSIKFSPAMELGRIDRARVIGEERGEIRGQRREEFEMLA